MRFPKIPISRVVRGGKMAPHMLKMVLGLAWKDGMGSLLHTPIIIWALHIMNLGVALRQLILQVGFGIEDHLGHLPMVPQVLLVGFIWSHFLIIVLRCLLLV